MKDIYIGALFGSIGAIVTAIVFGRGFESGKDAVLTIGGNVLIGAVIGGIVFYLFAKVKKTKEEK